MSAAIPEPLRMKDLLARTGVSKQAIHFYLREGLLPQPKKPQHNLAHYSEEHVVRIQTIKRLQEERGLSLSKIKGLMSKLDLSDHSFTDDLSNFELALHARIDGDLPSVDRTVKDVARSTGLSEQQIRKLDSVGAIRIKRGKGRASLDFRDVSIVECWAKLLQAGFAGREGFDEEFLRPYAEAMQPIAKLATEIFFKEFGESPTEEAVEIAAVGTAITNELLVQMHTQALMWATHERVESTNQHKNTKENLSND